jgi:RNA recognition motif-containing protein
MSIRLYVGNLSKDIQREAFETIFADYSEDLSLGKADFR